MFQLNTVTYGMSCAPFLAIRSLKFLADRYEEEFPVGASVLNEEMYVDDLLTGAETVEDLQLKITEVTNILSKAGLDLAKWNTSLNGEASEFHFKVDSKDITKALANRISEMQTIAPNIIWRHVPGKDNPADIVSRGCKASDLEGTIWFTGPEFLSHEAPCWPQTSLNTTFSDAELEQRKAVVLKCSDGGTAGNLLSIYTGNIFMRIRKCSLDYFVSKYGL
ncbi:hypothetical protein ACLKA7_007365 [Drosophila subpalustris]